MIHEPIAFEATRPTLPSAPAWVPNSPAAHGWQEERELQRTLPGSAGPLSGVVRRIDGMSYRFAGADSLAELDLALELVMKRYAWRGYDTEGALGGCAPSREVTFVASCGDQVAGTLTVRVDGQTDLLAEQLYPREIEGLRHRKANLCEFGRLAFDEGINTLEILGPLFHLGMDYARTRHGCTDVVIEVNPRHVGFYQRVFGFEVLGGERTCERVSAPAVLLRLPLGEAAFRAAVQGGERAGRRSIYPYCLGRAELAAFRRDFALLHPCSARDELATVRTLC